jgi:hypothetical protein
MCVSRIVSHSRKLQLIGIPVHFTKQFVPSGIISVMQKGGKTGAPYTMIHRRHCQRKSYFSTHIF